MPTAKPKSRNTKPAKVKRNGKPGGAYVITCPVYNCRGYHEERSSQQGAHLEKARHNREKHAPKVKP